MATFKRTPNQTLVAFACHRELLRSLDAARAQTGLDRSHFIRQAVCAELKRQGVRVPNDWALAPDRAKKVRYEPEPPPRAKTAAPASRARRR